MPNNIIKDQNIVEDTWQLLDVDTKIAPDDAIIVPVSFWNENKAQLSKRAELGIWLNSDESPKLIADSLDLFQVIAINFPGFNDGRGFSYARELREQHNYKGEIRAIGDFMRDQLFYLQRCGFNAFALEGNNLEQALDSLNDFSESYQASMDQPEPLFKRR